MKHTLRKLLIIGFVVGCLLPLACRNRDFPIQDLEPIDSYTVNPRSGFDSNSILTKNGGHFSMQKPGELHYTNGEQDILIQKDWYYNLVLRGNHLYARKDYDIHTPSDLVAIDLLTGKEKVVKAGISRYCFLDDGSLFYQLSEEETYYVTDANLKNDKLIQKVDCIDWWECYPYGNYVLLCDLNNSTIWLYDHGDSSFTKVWETEDLYQCLVGDSFVYILQANPDGEHTDVYEFRIDCEKGHRYKFVDSYRHSDRLGPGLPYEYARNCLVMKADEAEKLLQKVGSKEVSITATRLLELTSEYALVNINGTSGGLYTQFEDYLVVAHDEFVDRGFLANLLGLDNRRFSYEIIYLGDDAVH